MPDWTFCPKCATKLTAGALTCPGCGTEMRDLTPTGAGGASADASDAGLEQKLQEALQPTYLLVRQLGAGGMGAVFLAREPALRRSVAVKVLSAALAADPNARARFEREAQAVARMAHPNVVAIHGLGELQDGRPYFVMQYVDGPTLSERVEAEGPLGVEETRRLVGEVASALSAAHARGIVHRDVKPANVLYDRESGRALVTDFGIAAVRAAGDAPVPPAKLTSTGLALGTPQYMSPEQLLAEPVTERTDIYGLGLVGYELLTGRAPFAATTPQELIAAHLRDTPTPIATLRPDVDPELDALLTRCLAKQADARPTAAEVAQRLLPGAGALLEWPPPGLDHLHGALARHSHRLWVGSLALAVAMLTFVTLGAAVSGIGQVMVAALAVLGSIALVTAVAVLVRDARRAAGAVRSGFSWLTVGEVAADSRGDTGAVIAGAKEYAGLEPSRRGAVRMARLQRGLLALGGSMLPGPMLVLVAWLGAARLVGPGATPWLVFGPSVIALAATLWLDWRERVTVGSARRQLRARKRRPEGIGGLVEPWYASFDAVQGGQPLGRGRLGRPRTGWAMGIALGVMTAGAALILLPLWFFSAVGSAMLGKLTPTTSVTLEKAAVANLVREFAVPPDTTITPQQAGAAFWALQYRGTTNSPARFFPEHAPASLPELPLPGDSLFVGRRDAGWGGPAGDSVLVMAVTGRLTRTERAYLATLAASPAWEAFSTVARAPAMDYLGARFVLPFPDTATWPALPIPRFAGTKQLAYANAARAAYFLTSGRPTEAEAALRETVSFGLQVMEGATLIDVLIGAVIVGIGRSQLIGFYDVMGRPEGAVLRSRIDSALAADTTTRDPPGAGGHPRMRRDRSLAIAYDASLPRSLRIELGLLPLGLAPCTNARELLFGMSPSADSAFADARRTLARFPSEAALLDLIQESAVRGLPGGVGASPSGGGWKVGLLGRSILAATRAGSILLRNPRLQGCGEYWVAASLIS